MLRPIMLALLCGSLAAGPTRDGSAQPPITFASLLGSLADERLDRVLTSGASRAEVFSSRDPGSITPSEPESWFSDADAGHAIRIDSAGDRTEWVLADSRGPGALVRIVLDCPKSVAEAVLRVRIDGATEPMIEWPLRELRSAVAPRFAPFVRWNPASVRPNSGEDAAAGAREAWPSAGTLDCILPIPFARSCTVTIDRRPEAYRIETTLFDDGRAVESMTRAALDSADAEVVRAREAMMARMRSASAPADGASGIGRIEPGARLERTHAAGGVVRRLALRIDPYEARAAVRDLWLEFDFDGERCVRMPLGFFFGLGDRTGPTGDAFRTVEASGLFESRIPMPFAREARLAIANRGTRALAADFVAIEVAAPDAQPGAIPVLLHGAYRRSDRLPSEPAREIELARIEGRGVLLGETFAAKFGVLAIERRRGDERLSIDGGKALAGPSAELYFGFGDEAPRVARGLLVSVAPSPGALTTLGWAASRMRVLDALAFSRSLVKTVEVLPTERAGSEQNLSHGVLWYARAGETRGVGFDDPTVMPPVATPRSLAPLEEIFADGGVDAVEWIEAEDALIAGYADGMKWDPNSIGVYEPGHAWGQGYQIVARSLRRGDWIEFKLPVDGDAARRLAVRFAKSMESGRVQVKVNGSSVAGEFNLSAEKPEPAELIDLGVHKPEGGWIRVRLEASGLGDFSRSRMFICVDGFRLSEP